MKISIRKLSPQDARAYRRIRLESLKTDPESFDSDFEEQEKLPRLMFEKAIESPPDNRFVMGAFDQTALVGICGFLPFAMVDFHELPGTGTILQMYVQPPYRNQEIGTNLIKAVLEKAFKLPGIEQIVLEVRAENEGAVRVYEKVGFKSYPTEKHEPEPHGEGLQTMIVSRDRYKPSQSG